MLPNEAFAPQSPITCALDSRNQFATIPTAIVSMHPWAIPSTAHKHKNNQKDFTEASPKRPIPQKAPIEASILVVRTALGEYLSARTPETKYPIEYRNRKVESIIPNWVEEYP
mmetsp:Transcript_2439/g.3854  ORF Transcript_2439/g.3854 Transcript_2439/m.3854 type:complete len:113 (-) Transcript_2439:106-444(-)